MIRLRAISITTVFFLLCWCNAFTQSNQGREFWTGYLSHQEDNGTSQMSLYITADQSTSGQVEITDGSFAAIPFTVTANQVTIVNIPRAAFLKNQEQFLKGLHITALKNITVYAHIYAQSVSGATLLLPVSTLGKDYYSINYTQVSNAKKPSYSTFMVIATEDNTTVEVTPSNTLADGRPANVPFTLSLKKGELYQGLSLSDLTNTRIRSLTTSEGQCKKVAVFSGSTKIAIGCFEAGSTSDNLFQQVYPTASWGKNYITVPLKSRNYDIFRIILSDPNTVITVNGNQVNTGDALFYEFSSQTTNVIKASKPVQVVQYSVTQGQVLGSCQGNPADIGDPEMIYLTPTEQTLDHVTLYSTSNYAITNNFVNVVIKKSMVPTFTLDGTPYTKFTDVAADPGYAYAQISVNYGTHYMNAADGFNAIAYGFGRAESYGYAAGANLKNLNEYIALADKGGNALIQVNGCTGVEYKLQLTLPYQTSSIQWNLNDGSTPYTDNNPIVVSTIQKDGVTLYNYVYYKTVKFTPGDYSITATVANPLADVCGATTDVDFGFNIVDYPDVTFATSGTCQGDSVAFTDNSNDKGSKIKTWLWDFGDRQTSVLQNPGHIYHAAGNYQVVLTVVNENGCSSVSQPVVLHIVKKPVALFENSMPACLGSNIIFNDQSVAGEGAVIKWAWSFGDGSPGENYTTNATVSHRFLAAGTYTVKLIVTSSSGCSATYDKNLVISSSPVADFILPDVCLEDAFAQFTDNTTIADNSTAGLTYHWDFGDNSAVLANPNTSAEKNPRHKYSRADNYMVTLTVTSAEGCTAAVQKQITVNGSIASAKFSVDNAGSLCSANAIIFNDQSAASFGNITKLVWYYDYAANPLQAEVFNKADLTADHKYKHVYPAFNSPLTKTYMVKLEAYSGQTCMKEYIQDIVVHANPLVRLVQLSPVCQGSAPVQLVADLNGFTGAGVFSGKGISNTGLFDPNVAGAGKITITYNFTTQNGCGYTTTEDIVINPSPVVNAGDDIVLLEGDNIILKATASGNGLTYRWEPATSLDHSDVLNPLSSVTNDTDYKLFVTNADGCTTTDDIFVKVLKKPVITNTFTPNNDGINDTWGIKYLENYPGNTVDVFNRYGTKIYSSIGYPIPWDGRYRGSDLPMGTYYYIINPKNGRKVISGNVTIIR